MATQKAKPRPSGSLKVKLRVAASPEQRVLTAQGKIKIGMGKRARKLPLERAQKTANPWAEPRMILRLKRGERQVKRALKAKKQVRAKVNVTAQDELGHHAADLITVKVSR